MTRERFSLALERLPASAWERFEDLASVFLRAEYPNIRRTSAPAGDLGVDAMFWQPEGDPVTLLQYSVTSDWADKIVRTAKRVRANFEAARILIYVTSQRIGPGVHELRGRLARDFRLHLDVRDREWFLDSMGLSQTSADEAERLSREFADPYLASGDVLVRKAQSLTTNEAQAAVLYLGMQWEDDIREKGLTELSGPEFVACCPVYCLTGEGRRGHALPGGLAEAPRGGGLARRLRLHRLGRSLQAESQL